MTPGTFPPVAVIVLTWNQRDLTLDCLVSLAEMDYPADRLQVIVVDNGSRDGTAAAVRERFPHVTVLENSDNLGFAEGNNVGIRHALKGPAEYIMLLNNDTAVDRQILNELLAAMKQRPDAGIVGPKMLYFEPSNVIWCAGNRIDWRAGGSIRLQAEEPDTRIVEQPREADFITACAILLRRQVIEQIGLLDPRFFIYYEEIDWCVRAHQAGWRILYVPAARLWHKVSAAMGTTSPPTDYYMNRNMLLFLAKNLDGPARLQAVIRAAGRNLLAVAAYTVKPHSGRRIPPEVVICMKVLILGYNPPPLQPGSKLEAVNYRTWQFVMPLLSDGHEICLCVEESSQRPGPDIASANLIWEPVPFDSIGWIGRLQAVHDRFGPDCVIAVDFYPSLWATKLRTTRPIWMDLYGDPLAVMQVARYRVGSDQGIGTAIALAGRLLRRGDVFSVCGVPQQHLLVGELAMCGRLNARTFGYDFVRPIYPGSPPVPDQARIADRGSLRKAYGIEAEAFVVLWCGGYNTWTDVETLFGGLEAAMERSPQLHFVSVGASTYQARETVYDHLTSMAWSSRYAARFHLFGWQPWEKVPDFYAISDIGISIDALHYETLYGTRTRLVEMLAYGLPVITSEGCELSYLIPQKRAGLSFPSGSSEALAQHLLSLASAPAVLEQMRATARQLACDEFSFYSTTCPLRTWAAHPELAPDKRPAGKIPRIEAARYQLRTIARLALWQFGLSGRRPSPAPRR